MLKRIVAIGVVGLIFAGLLSGCTIGGLTVIQGSGNKTTETRQVSGFNAVELTGIGKLIVKQTGTESLTIEGDDNIVPKVTTQVSGNKLLIGMEEGITGTPKTPLVYNLTVKDIKSLALSGAGDIQADDLKVSGFAVQISGAGNATMNGLTADSLDAKLTGAGNFETNGTVPTQTVSISGVGSYNAGDLQSGIATVSVSGAGSATVWVTTSLNANLSGVGSIKYYGSPTVQQNKSGVGSITKIGDK